MKLRKKGFTLVELLVVISIIALLLSILMPSLGRARAMAQQVVCLTNIKQNGSAFLLYATDNNGSFVRGSSGWDGLYTNDGNGGDTPDWGLGYWLADLKAYRGDDIKTLTCPSAKKVNPGFASNPMGEYQGWINYSAAWGYPMEGLSDVSFDNPIPISYSMNGFATNPDKGSEIEQTDRSNGTVPAPYDYCWKKFEKLSSPDVVPIFSDGRWLGGFSNSDRIGYLQPPATLKEAENGTSMYYNWGIGQYCIPRHISGTNMLYGDFSTRKTDLKDLWKLKWNRNFNINNRYAIDETVFPDWIK